MLPSYSPCTAKSGSFAASFGSAMAIRSFFFGCSFLSCADEPGRPAAATRPAASAPASSERNMTNLGVGCVGGTPIVSARMGGSMGWIQLSGGGRERLRFAEARELAEEGEELLEQARGVAGAALDGDRVAGDGDLPGETCQRDL